MNQSRCRYQFSPISRLPADIFIDIIAFASEYEYEYGSDDTPLSKPPRLNMVVSSLLVSRSWYQAVQNSTRLWSTLRLDGTLNVKNAEKKILWWSEKALGRSTKDIASSESDGRGIQKLVISAAGSLNLSKLLGVLRDTGAADQLEEVTVSFIDEGASTKEPSPIDYRGLSLEGFILDTCRTTLRSLIWCSERPVGVYHSLPDPSLFPRLERLWVYGTLSSAGSTLRYYLFPFLSPAGGAIRSDIASPLIDLRVVHVILISSASAPSFDAPRLKSIDVASDRMSGLDEMVLNLNSPWFNTVIHLPQMIRFHLSHGQVLDDGIRTSHPDLSTSWQRLESLEIVQSHVLATYLLDLAVSQGINFHHLTRINLRSASLSLSHLVLFSENNSPSLVQLLLGSTRSTRLSATLELPNFSSTLEVLDLSNSLWVTDDTINSLVLSTPNLIRLNLSGIEHLTSRPIMQYVQSRLISPPNSTSVSVSEQTSKKVVPTTKKYHSLLEELKLEGCHKIEEIAVKWMRERIQSGGFKWSLLNAGEKATRGRRYDL